MSDVGEIQARLEGYQAAKRECKMLCFLPEAKWSDVEQLLAEVERLERERDAAVNVIREVDGLSVLSSTVQFMNHAMEITGRYLYPELYAEVDKRTGDTPAGGEA